MILLFPVSKIRLYTSLYMHAATLARKTAIFHSNCVCALAMLCKVTLVQHRSQQRCRLLDSSWLIRYKSRLNNTLDMLLGCQMNHMWSVVGVPDDLPCQSHGAAQQG
jgi:hypothetical protein